MENTNETQGSGQQNPPVYQETTTGNPGQGSSQTGNQSVDPLMGLANFAQTVGGQEGLDQLQKSTTELNNHYAAPYAKNAMLHFDAEKKIYNVVPITFEGPIFGDEGATASNVGGLHTSPSYTYNLPVLAGESVLDAKNRMLAEYAQTNKKAITYGVMDGLDTMTFHLAGDVIAPFGRYERNFEAEHPYEARMGQGPYSFLTQFFAMDATSLPSGMGGVTGMLSDIVGSISRGLPVNYMFSKAFKFGAGAVKGGLEKVFTSNLWNKLAVGWQASIEVGGTRATTNVPKPDAEMLSKFFNSENIAEMAKNYGHDPATSQKFGEFVERNLSGPGEKEWFAANLGNNQRKIAQVMLETPASLKKFSDMSDWLIKNSGALGQDGTTIYLKDTKIPIAEELKTLIKEFKSTIGDNRKYIIKYLSPEELDRVALGMSNKRVLTDGVRQAGMNPILSYLDLHQKQVTNIASNFGGGASGAAAVVGTYFAERGSPFNTNEEERKAYRDMTPKEYTKYILESAALGGTVASIFPLIDNLDNLPKKGSSETTKKPDPKRKLLTNGS